MMPVVGAVFLLTCGALAVLNNGKVNVTPAGAIGPFELYASVAGSTAAGTMYVFQR